MAEEKDRKHKLTEHESENWDGAPVPLDPPEGSPPPPPPTKPPR